MTVLAGILSSKQADLLKPRRLVARALHISMERVHEDTSINTLEAWDSLGGLRIVLAIEEAMGTELTIDQIVSIESVRDIANLLQL